MNKIRIKPTLIYFLICTSAWAVYLASKGLFAFLGMLLLGLSTVDLIFAFGILHEIPDPFLVTTAQWAPSLSANQELLLYQAFNLLIIFSITNDYQTSKIDKITLVRRCAPFFFIGGFLLYSGFVNFVLHADKHASNARDDVQLVMTKAKKIEKHIKDTGKLPTNMELNCDSTPCKKSYFGPYWEIFLHNNGYRVEIRKLRFTGHKGPFYSSTTYKIIYDSKSKTTNYDHLTKRGWWILCFTPRAILLLAIMVFPLTIRVAKRRIRYFRARIGRISAA